MDKKLDFEIIKFKEISLGKGNLKKILDLRAIKAEEIYSSDIAKNQIKGWKMHTTQTSRLYCIDGDVDFFLKNDNDHTLIKIKLNKSDNKILIIHPENWYAFRGNDLNNTIMNFASHYHDSNESKINLIKQTDEENIENKVVKVFS